jgi:glyoxylase-like metal-dependent hydrolase (beta-lactamase superfamily II)
MMRTIRTTSIVVLSLVVCLFARDTAAQGGGADDSITKLTESAFRRGNTSNVFIVTSDGIIVVDGTCSGGGQEWLKAELDRRYDVPVKYVILTHDHEMHICGTQVFSDTAITISHRNARPHIVREKRDSAVPDVTFEDDSMEIHLGGKRVVLYYFGHTHSDNLIQVHFPEEGVLVATDIVRSGPGGKAIGLPDVRESNVNNLIDALDQLSRLDNVDIVVPGHGGLADQQGFVYYRMFLVALRDRVQDELVACRSIDEILKRVTMEDFSDYGNYKEWLRDNVVTMWDHLYRLREPSESSECRGNYHEDWLTRIQGGKQ